MGAFTGFYGAWGFTNGVEWLATEKIDVHGCSALNWGSKDNLIDEISKINAILEENPALWRGDNLRILSIPNKEISAFYRSDELRGNYLLIIANLDCDNEVSLNVSLIDLGINLPFRGNTEALDLLDRISYGIKEGGFKINLGKGQVSILQPSGGWQAL